MRRPSEQLSGILLLMRTTTGDAETCRVRDDSLRTLLWLARFEPHVGLMWMAL